MTLALERTSGYRDCRFDFVLKSSFMNVSRRCQPKQSNSRRIPDEAPVTRTAADLRTCRFSS